MTQEQPLEYRVICPSCGALNPANARVCTSCGIHIADYQEALPLMRQAEEQERAPQRQRLQAEAAAIQANEVSRGRRRLCLYLGIALGAAVALGLVIFLLTSWYAEAQRQRQQRLAGQYAVAEACLERQEYNCARDELIRLLREEPDYRDAQARLGEARYGLALQYVAAGQWKAAVAEMDQLLQEDPGNLQALALLRDTYDRWIDEAWTGGDLIMVLGLTQQRNARFGPER